MRLTSARRVFVPHPSVFTFQTVIWASLSVVAGFGLLIRFRPMPAENLALSLLGAVGALLVFGTAVLAAFIEPTLIEIRLRLRQLELHQQVSNEQVEIDRLRATMQQFTRETSDRTGGRSNVYVLPGHDPDEPEETEDALPAGAGIESETT